MLVGLHTLIFMITKFSLYCDDVNGNVLGEISVFDHAHAYVVVIVVKVVE